MASRSLIGVFSGPRLKEGTSSHFTTSVNQVDLVLDKFKNLCPNLVDGDVKFFQYFHKTQKKFDFILCLLEGEISRG